MNVGELIEELKKFDPNYKIKMLYNPPIPEDCGLCVESFESDSIITREPYFKECDDIKLEEKVV